MTVPSPSDASPAIVIAMGGNSLLDPALPPTIDNQFAVTQRAVEPIAELMAAGYRFVLTHGNGPQVGWMLLRSELSRSQLHEVPLDSLVASSQGGIGYMLQRLLKDELTKRGVHAPLATVMTEVEVDPADPAFAKPTKPVGMFYSAEEAEKRRRENGWAVAEDAKRGWRRVVPSPLPKAIVELDVIRMLISAGATVISCGGGGVPVMRNQAGLLSGLEAVIDKDRTSALLAVDLGAERLIITTGTDKVYRDYMKGTPTPIDVATASELRALLAEGQFPAGSMGPKIDAALYFLDHGGQSVTICRPEDLVAAIDGRAGTLIVK